MLGHIFSSPLKYTLVHCITNYVTVNDCANILLAAVGSPIMSDDMKEVQEITSLCGGLAVKHRDAQPADDSPCFWPAKRQQPV